MTEEEEDKKIARDYGESHEEIGATMDFVIWFQDKHPEKQFWTGKEHQAILDLFREHIVLLSLSKNRAVSRQEAVKFIIER
jgi:hypothetical protein